MKTLSRFLITIVCMLMGTLLSFGVAWAIPKTDGVGNSAEMTVNATQIAPLYIAEDNISGRKIIIETNQIQASEQIQLLIFNEDDPKPHIGVTDEFGIDIPNDCSVVIKIVAPENNLYIFKGIIVNDNADYPITSVIYTVDDSLLSAPLKLQVMFEPIEYNVIVDVIDTAGNTVDISPYLTKPTKITGGEALNVTVDETMLQDNELYKLVSIQIRYTDTNGVISYIEYTDGMQVDEYFIEHYAKSTRNISIKISIIKQHLVSFIFPTNIDDEWGFAILENATNITEKFRKENNYSYLIDDGQKLTLTSQVFNNYILNNGFAGLPDVEVLSPASTIPIKITEFFVKYDSTISLQIAPREFTLADIVDNADYTVTKNTISFGDKIGITLQNIPVNHGIKQWTINGRDYSAEVLGNTVYITANKLWFQVNSSFIDLENGTIQINSTPTTELRGDYIFGLGLPTGGVLLFFIAMIYVVATNKYRKKVIYEHIHGKKIKLPKPPKPPKPPRPIVVKVKKEEKVKTPPVTEEIVPVNEYGTTPEPQTPTPTPQYNMPTRAVADADTQPPSGENGVSAIATETPTAPAVAPAVEYNMPPTSAPQTETPTVPTQPEQITQEPMPTEQAQPEIQPAPTELPQQDIQPLPTATDPVQVAPQIVTEQPATVIAPETAQQSVNTIPQTPAEQPVMPAPVPTAPTPQAQPQPMAMPQTPMGTVAQPNPLMPPPTQNPQQMGQQTRPMTPQGQPLPQGITPQPQGQQPPAGQRPMGIPQQRPIMPQGQPTQPQGAPRPIAPNQVPNAFPQGQPRPMMSPTQTPQQMGQQPRPIIPQGQARPPMGQQRPPMPNNAPLQQGQPRPMTPQGQPIPQGITPLPQGQQPPAGQRPMGIPQQRPMVSQGQPTQQQGAPRPIAPNQTPNAFPQGQPRPMSPTQNPQQMGQQPRPMTPPQGQPQPPMGQQPQTGQPRPVMPNAPLPPRPPVPPQQ